MAKCLICGKGPVAGNLVPKSKHKTRRFIRPNVQKVNGLKLCTRCLRTLKRSVDRADQVGRPVQVQTTA